MTEEPKTLNEPVKHKRWANSVEGLFTAISYVFGIGNVLIFPYYCGIHGGAAFLFPVAIVYIFVGFPITYIELSLGQFASISPHRIFKKLSLPFTGISAAIIFVVSVRMIYFSSILAQSLLAAFSSRSDSYHCNPKLHSVCFDFDLSENCTSLLAHPDCDAHLQYESSILYDNVMPLTPHLTYLMNNVYRPTYTTNDSVVDPRYPALQFYSPNLLSIFSLVFVWVLAGFLCYFGVRTIGKSAYILAPLPFILMFSMMIRSLVLDVRRHDVDRDDCNNESSNHDVVHYGVEQLFTAEISTMKRASVWVDDIVFVLFSISLGDGGLIKIASHNKFTNNVLRDAITICLFDFVMNLMSGITFFSSVGVLAAKVYDPETLRCEPFDKMERIKLMMSHGNVLMMAAFPESLNGHPDQSFFIFLHYFNLFILGLQSMVMSMDVVLSAFIDKWPKLQASWKLRALALGVFILFGFILSWWLIAPAGIYLSLLLQKFSSLALMFICFFEVISVLFFYGFDRFIATLESMKQISSRVGISVLWIILKFVVITIFVVAIFLKMTEFSSLQSTKQIFGMYIFADIFELFGWLLPGMVFFLIGYVMLGLLIKYHFSERRPVLIFFPKVEWEPLEEEDRQLARERQLAIGIAN